jgi:hypothetical protein
MKTRYYYEQLSENAKIIYKGLYQAIQRLQEVANIPGKIRKEEVPSILYALRYDNPELYYFNWIEYYILNADSVTFKLIYTYPVKTIPGRNKYIQQLINNSIEIYKKKRISDEFNTSLWIHNHIAHLVTYDEESYEGKSEKRRHADAHSIAGVFCRKTAVCEGIALAYKLLCDKLGIYCIVAVGKASSSPSDTLENNNGHAWNIIRIGDKYAHVDVTWNMCMSRGCKKTRYDYFGVSDRIIKSNHQWEKYPVCVDGSGLTYFEQNKCVMSNISELNKFLDESISNKAESLYFQIKKEEGKVFICDEDVRNAVNDKAFSRKSKCKEYTCMFNSDLGIYMFLLNY